MPPEKNVETPAEDSLNVQTTLSKDIPSPEKPQKNKKKFIILGIALILLGAVASMVLLNNRQKEKVTDKSIQSVGTTYSNQDPVLCTGLGLNSLQCENLDTKELKKYILPSELDDLTSFIPSPDEKHFFVSGWDVSEKESPAEYRNVYDAKLKLKTKLPAVINSDDNTADIAYARWLDNERIVYTKFRSKPKDDMIVYSYNINTNKEEAIFETTVPVRNLMPKKGENKAFATQDVMGESQSLSTQLILIDFDTKTLKTIDITGIESEVDSIRYSAATDLFYVNVLNQEEQTNSLTIHKLDNSDAKLKLTQTDKIANVNFSGGVITRKGLKALKDTEIVTRAPITLYTATNTFTESNISVGGGGSLEMTLATFPEFTPAETNKAVTSDFFKPAKNTPERIVKFLEKMVTEYPECKQNEFMTYEIRNYDGDSQFSTSEYGCATDGLAVYKLKNDTYELVTRTQEGLMCAERDRLGISKKVVPDCHKEGEDI